MAFGCFWRSTRRATPATSPTDWSNRLSRCSCPGVSRDIHEARGTYSNNGMACDVLFIYVSMENLKKASISQIILRRMVG
jgi:hypothetical protein